MAQGDVNVTIVGNLTSDPELRFTPSGAAVASFTIASTPRMLDKATNEWKDGDTIFMRCSVWRQYAENVAESLTRGARVIATGRLKQRSFETREGEKRTVVEMDVDDVGPALKNATAKVSKVARSGAGGGGFGGDGGFGGQPGGQQPGGEQGDPWSGQQQSGSGSGSSWSGGGGGAAGGGGSPSYDEPPF
jgi:single-strand DNA-binding protein